ncbi:MAG TPA: glycosyltransferase family 4 protein [Gemmatimonadaceae bacterium]|nr:glycosyltransferase family 4 protein [Gemmatimonadaceae bacterium]
MTRVLFWCDAFWPNIGGVEVLGARLVTALRERGHELMVVTRRDELALAAESSFEGVPVRRFEFLQVAGSRDAFRWLELRRKIAALKREFAPDVVHVYHAAFDAILHLETRDAHRAAELCTIHGAIPDHVLLPGSMLRRLLTESDWVAACSASALDRVRHQVPEIEAHSSVILNGLESTTYPPTPPPLEVPRLLCVGRLATDEKGFDLAIIGLARLARRYPRLRLTIAGDGEERARLAHLAEELGVADRVDFLGWVNPAVIPAVIAQSTLVLMPSRSEEGFGLAVLQAGQLERPVIAARVGGLPEVVADGETGLLVEPEDSGALARAIALLLDDPPRALAMGKAARRRALNAFSWEQHVDAYDRLIHTLVARRGARAGSARA